MNVKQHQPLASDNGAVSARTREIATLGAMGYGGGPVAVSVVLEAVLLSLLGAAAGAGIAWLV